MSQFIQPPRQKYKRPQNASTVAPQQQNGCSQFLFLMAILMLVNILFLKACAPEKEEGANANSNVMQAIASVEASKVDEAIQENKAKEAPNTAEAPTTAENDVQPPATMLEVAPTEVPNPAENATEKDTENATSVEGVQDSYLTLGSADPESEYRMLVTFTSRGAAVARVELNERRLASMGEAPDFKGGYLGALSYELRPTMTGGCLVQVVGAGTPAEKAGIQVGDRILKVNDIEVENAQDLTTKIQKYKPGTTLALTVSRNGAEVKLNATLTREPVSVISPEMETPETQGFEEASGGVEPYQENNKSFLTTFYTFGSHSLSKLDLEVRNQIAKDNYSLLDTFLNQEIGKFDMHSASWEVENHTSDSITFLYKQPDYGMEVRKTYTLVRVEENQRNNEASPTYHLTLNVTAKNVGTQAQNIALQQDGPTGLLTEGHWFCSKAGRGWSATGIRDVLIGYVGTNTPNVYTCSKIAEGKWGKHILCTQKPLSYIGVDAQYFSSILIPDIGASTLPIERFTALRVGNVPKQWVMKTNTSCRIISSEKTLKPGEETTQQFTVFVGPKRPKLLSQYSLDNVVYYGWFSWIAKILVGILHIFYTIFGNYGIAILLLTILVRVLMFPLSKKQILNSIIMQKIQPEIKRIQDKYTDPLEKQRAQMELFKKYKCNPMSGCWVMLIQLPIFIALYRALLVDVELRQASLITDSIRFCSNLVAPDMFWSWQGIMPSWVSSGYGIFGLGPYFNLLPILTIAIFILQQKIMMPPALDEQARMQQNMMKFMMIFMGFLFFKVPCGLCIYFIISSLWGLLERKFMPSADSLQLSPDGVIDMRIQNGTATMNTPKQPKEGFFARLSRKMEEIQKAVEERDAERERQKKREAKEKRRNR